MKYDPGKECNSSAGCGKDVFVERLRSNEVTACIDSVVPYYYLFFWTGLGVNKASYILSFDTSSNQGGQTPPLIELIKSLITNKTYNKDCHCLPVTLMNVVCCNYIQYKPEYFGHYLLPYAVSTCPFYYNVHFMHFILIIHNNVGLSCFALNSIP